VEEQTLRASEHKVLKRTSGSRRQEMRAERRKLHNEELHNLSSLVNIIRVTKPRRR